MRRNCEIPQYGEEVKDEPGAIKTDRKIGMLMLHEPSPKSSRSWADDMLSSVLNNRKVYSNLHGYELIDISSRLDSSKPAAWSKLPALQEALSTGKYDYVLYIDMDVLIMNLELKLESIIDAAGDKFDIVCLISYVKCRRTITVQSVGARLVTKQ